MDCFSKLVFPFPFPCPTPFFPFWFFSFPISFPCICFSVSHVENIPWLKWANKACAVMLCLLTRRLEVQSLGFKGLGVQKFGCWKAQRSKHRRPHVWVCEWSGAALPHRSDAFPTTCSVGEQKKTLFGGSLWKPRCRIAAKVQQTVQFVTMTQND